MIAKKNIAIVGGGLGGLTAALLCAQRSAKVTVYEQAPAFAEVGAGIQMSANALRVLDAAGLGAEARQIGFASKGVTLNSSKGSRVAILPNGARETLLFHRADLLGLLERAARAAGVSFAFHTLVTPDQRPDADLVVAANGAKSEFRPWITGLDTQAQFSGQVAWRALVPMQRPVPEGGVNVYMGAGQHIVLYPLRGGTVLNIVAVEERDDWRDVGWSVPGDPAELAARFAQFGDPVPALLSRVEQVFRWGLFTHPVARPMSRENCVLLGDAAHPMLPFLAQGAAMAIEDAQVLADCLGRWSDEHALAQYENVRRPRVSRVMSEAQANARRFHLTNPIAKLGAHIGLGLASRVTPGLLTGRYDWLYNFDATQVVERAD